ncbi:hypothetical protein ID866_12328 [Astraeus odoratus]|nr:hypothetical protein ID866_12328 [Astraeus odoratus]
MSTCKSSMVTGTPVKKTVDWTEVPNEELATDLDDTDSVEEAEKCWKEEERRQKEAEAEQRRKDKERKQAAAAKARKRQWADLEAQASRSWTNVSVCIRCTRLKLICIIPAGVKKRSACGLCVKAKERCEWPEVEMMASRARMSPRGGECRKWAKKAADDDEIVILSGRKTKQQGGGETLEEITSTVQSSGCKMQWHHLLMEGLVGQQQLLVSKLVEMVSAAGSGGAKEVAEDQEGPKELQGEESGGQEGETEGVPGGVLENAPGEEPENDTGVEDGTETEGQQSKAKGKGKEKAL